MNKTNNEGSTTYRVLKPNFKTWFIYLLLIIILSTGYLLIFFNSISKVLLPPEIDVEFQLDEIFWGLIMPNIAMIIISPIIWDKISNLILSKKWMNSFSKLKLDGKNKFMIFKSILGIKPKTSNEYYLELNVVNSDLKNIEKTFSKKIVGAIAGTIGLTFIGASILRIVLTSWNSSFDSLDVLFLSIMLMQIVPLIMSIFIPVNWTLNDIALHYKNKEYFVQDVGNDMSSGIFRKFIGIGGLILGVNVCYNLAYDQDTLWFINIWVTLIYFTFFFLLISAGTTILISLTYLIVYHQDKVNFLRNKFMNIVGFGQTEVKRGHELSSQPADMEMIQPKRKALSYKVIETLILLIFLGLAIFGEFYVLFVVGPFSLSI